MKRQAPIMCVIGNPPYSGESANKGDWINGLMEAYKLEPGGKEKLKEKNSKWINKDEHKFIRLASHYIERNGEGVLGFITSHGYLSDPTLRGMRWEMLRTFDSIYVLDLQKLTTDLDAFADWLGSPSVFDRKRKKPLKPNTIKQYRHNVTISVSALVRSGISMSDLATLADVVRPERVDQVLRYLYARAGNQLTPMMFQLALRVRTIARWCDLPQKDLDGLEEIVDDLKEQYEPKRGMTAKNRKLLDRLEDQRFADQVQLLPFILLERARKNPNKPWAPALVRTALAIEVLLVCSVRRANLIDLELGKSIRKIGHGKDAFWVIERDGVEVKNEEDLRFKLDGPTVELLELYLRDWRPKLCPHSSPWLFPAADGTCLDPRTMAHAVGAQSKRVLGVAITPHQFRHISAALWMKDNPEGIFTISQHLGHRDVNTTRRYYAPPQQRRASRHFQEHILRSRETARIRIKRTTRRKRADGGFDERKDLL